MPSTFVDIALKSSILILVAALAAGWLARRSAASHRHFIWLLVMAGLLALPLLTRTVPRLPVLPISAQETGRRASDVVKSESPRSEAVPTPDSRLPTPVSAAHPAPRTANPPFDWQSVLTLKALWLAGVCFVSFRLLLAIVALWRMLRSARDVEEPTLLSSLDYATGRLDIWNDVELLESPRTRIPLTFGFRRPVVVLPPDASSWPAELQRVVLLHELAHVRRGDVFANVVCQVVCAIYWFHPLVWGAARRLRIEAERACDDLVLRAGAPASAYASHLLSMVQSIASLRAPALALPLAQRSAFEGRVLAILEPGLARHGLTARAAVFGITALLAIAVPLAALAPAAPRERERVVEPAPQEPAKPSPATAPDSRLPTPDSRSSDTTRETDQDADGTVIEASAQVPQQTQATPAAMAALITGLSDDIEAVRLASAQALGELELADTAALNALLSALRRDTSREVRKMAAWALAQIEDPRAIPGLLAALREERDDEVRKEIARALGEIESADAVDGLGAALRSEDSPEIRSMIVWALGEIESADAVPFLVPLLRDSDAEVRKQAVWALGEIESPRAVDPLSAMLQSERVVVVREMVVWALGEIEDRRALPALESALRDTAVVIRRKAAWAIGEIDDISTVPAGLLTATRDADVEVRRAAVHALAEIDDPSSVPALIAAMRDPDLEVRRGAVHALGEIRGAEAVEALVAAMRDEDPEIRRLAARALGNR